MAALTTEEATARAEAEVRAYCGWHIAPSKTETLTLDGSGTPVLVLPTLYVTEVVGITENGNVVELGDYEWSASGVVRRGTSGGPDPYAWAASWTARLRGITVEFTHGYDALPLDVQSVVEHIARLAVELSEASQVLSQVGQIRYAAGVDGLRETALLSEASRSVLDRYRLPKRP